MTRQDDPSLRTATKSESQGTLSKLCENTRPARVRVVRTEKFADPVAVAGDPIADITDLERVRFMIEDGRLPGDARVLPAGSFTMGSSAEEKS